MRIYKTILFAFILICVALLTISCHRSYEPVSDWALAGRRRLRPRDVVDACGAVSRPGHAAHRRGGDLTAQHRCETLPGCLYGMPEWRASSPVISLTSRWPTQAGDIRSPCSAPRRHAWSGAPTETAGPPGWLMWPCWSASSACSVPRCSVAPARHWPPRRRPGCR